MALRLLLSILAWNSLAWAGSFDQPTFKKTVDLGVSRASPGAHAKVTCYFYPHFMIKEVDRAEKGAERLAILPGKIKDHTCSHLREPGEKEISSDEWTGYFKGAKGDLVFFDADDGWNGGMGFIIYNARTGKKIYEDVALGDLTFSDASAPQLTITYTRVVDSGCNLPKDQAGCWSAAQKKFGFENAAAAPDCKSGYEKSAQELAKGRCDAQKSPKEQCLDKELSLARSQTADATSVISYPVELVLDPSPSVRAQAGELRCWPSD